MDPEYKVVATDERDRDYGVVVRFWAPKNFGFIEPDCAGTPDVFLHGSSLIEPRVRGEDLTGARVSYVLGLDERGRRRAVCVRVEQAADVADEVVE